MPIFDNIGGVQRQVAKSYSNINGAWHEDSKIYDNVNGVWRETHSSGIQGTLGTSISNHSTYSGATGSVAFSNGYFKAGGSFTFSSGHTDSITVGGYLNVAINGYFPAGTSILSIPTLFFEVDKAFSTVSSLSTTLELYAADNSYICGKVIELDINMGQSNGTYSIPATTLIDANGHTVNSSIMLRIIVYAYHNSGYGSDTGTVYTIVPSDSMIWLPTNQSIIF